MAEGSEGPGEKRSDGGGAGVSGGASRGFLTSASLMVISLSLAIPVFLGRALSFGRFRSRAIFAKSSLVSATFSLLERLTLTGELIGSVFTLSASSLESPSIWDYLQHLLGSRAFRPVAVTVADAPNALSLPSLPILIGIVA